MAFTVPTLKQLIDRARADFRTEAGIDVLRRSIESALVRVQAALIKGNYAYQKYLNDQAFPDTADEANFWRHAANRGIYQRAAAPAQLTVTFTGVDTTAIPAGTEATRSDGAVYTTDDDAEIGSSVSGEVDVAVTATEAGSDGNCEDGTVLTLSSPITDVDSEATVLATLVDGSDDETQADGYARYVQDVTSPQSDGGTAGDYVRWALEVEGVTRAWEYALGSNEVGVAFVRDNDGTGSAILPDAGERTAVEEYVQGEAPITVTVSVRTLTALTVNVTLTALSPDTADIRAAIVEELVDLFRREAEPEVTIELSQFGAAISAASGETSHVMSVPAAAVTPTSTEIPILGTVTILGDVEYP